MSCSDIMTLLYTNEINITVDDDKLALVLKLGCARYDLPARSKLTDDSLRGQALSLSLDEKDPKVLWGAFPTEQELPPPFTTVTAHALPLDTLANLLLRTAAAAQRGEHILRSYRVFFPVGRALQKVGTGRIEQLVMLEIHVSGGLLKASVRTFSRIVTYQRCCPVTWRRRQHQVLRLRLPNHGFLDLPAGEYALIQVPGRRNTYPWFTFEGSRIGGKAGAIREVLSWLDTYCGATLQLARYPAQVVLDQRYKPPVLRERLFAHGLGLQRIQILNYSTFPEAHQRLRQCLMSTFPELTAHEGSVQAASRFHRQQEPTLCLVVINDPGESNNASRTRYARLVCANPSFAFQALTVDTLRKLLTMDSSSRLARRREVIALRLLSEAAIKAELCAGSIGLPQPTALMVRSPLLILLRPEADPDTPPELIFRGHLCLTITKDGCLSIEWLPQEKDQFTDTVDTENFTLILAPGTNRQRTLRFRREETVIMPPLDWMDQVERELATLEQQPLGLPAAWVEAFIASDALLRLPGDVLTISQQLRSLVGHSRAAVHKTLGDRSKLARCFNDFISHYYGARFFPGWQRSDTPLTTSQAPLLAVEEGESYCRYAAGTYGGTRRTLAHATHLYRCDGAVRVTELQPLLQAEFVRAGAVACLPWPIKYLLEALRRRLLQDQLILGADDDEAAVAERWLDDSGPDE